MFVLRGELVVGGEQHAAPGVQPKGVLREGDQALLAGMQLQHFRRVSGTEECTGVYA